MKEYADYLGDATFTVVDYRRGKKFVDGEEKVGEKVSVYTVIHNYDKIEITVPDAGNIVTREQIRSYANNETPLTLLFKEAEVFIKPKSQFEIQARGTAQQATLVNPDKSK